MRYAVLWPSTVVHHPMHVFTLNVFTVIVRLPQVRYGRTGLMMPIITCGGMRQQFTWKAQKTATAENITKDCDKNFQAIVDR